ncbi:branched-chain amino acid aminotransferase [Micractinium conductrix]|uniref:Branched-chain-amino-acid aminotransferase n=1 Tax=Micractinium conductrix TaxID=554055 RepID=A0A2P6UZV6_9CHLO|nr:branched-chain amino acid aminotransferase [Micractinium conductrix]|eukprot:PSC67353.1 branched-chain amino acid aminotransferase [Micractinium conductrix]
MALAALSRQLGAALQPQRPTDRLQQRAGASRPATPCRRQARRLLCSAQLAAEQSSKLDIDWDSLGFGLQHVGATMFMASCSAADGKWSAGELQPYGPLPMYPSAQALNYGQAVFEGMKAQRSAKDRIVLFRPEANAERMAEGAARLSMCPPPKELFLEAVCKTVEANSDFVPPQGKGSLYLRPLLLGSGPILGLGPAPSYTLVVYCASVGSYFKGGQLTPIDLIVETRFHRSAPGGMGGTKCAGNYSPVLVTQLAAKKEGYSDVVYLDAKTDTYLEEVSSCNIFVVKGKTIRTPPLQGTILPGVTRRSIIELARSRGYTVEEVPVSVDEAMQADEIFTTGTAVVVSPVGSLTYQGERRQFGEPGQPGPVALELYDQLTGLQQEKLADPFGWVHPVC